MILEFEQGVIKIIPGLEKSSITIRRDSSVVIEADGSITISAKEVSVSSETRYSDPAYLKTLGPILAQGGVATTGYAQQVTSPGILMNANIYPGAMVSALDAGEKVISPPEEKYVVDGKIESISGLEKQPIQGSPDFKRLFKAWENDPVTKLYEGKLEVPEHAKGKDADEAARDGRLEDLYSMAMLSDDDDIDAVIGHCLNYLHEIGEDVISIMESTKPFGDSISSYLKALVQQHRVSLEEKAKAGIEKTVSEAERVLEEGRLLLERVGREIEDAIKGHEEKAHADVVRNGEVPSAEVPFEGAPLTEENVKSALDALGIGHFAKFNDVVHGYRGFFEGTKEMDARDQSIVNGYQKRAEKE